MKMLPYKTMYIGTHQAKIYIFGDFGIVTKGTASYKDLATVCKWYRYKFWHLETGFCSSAMAFSDQMSRQQVKEHLKLKRYNQALEKLL